VGRGSGKEGGPLLFETRDLWHVYPGGVEALRGVDLRLGEGEHLVLLGENGSGKTTLLRCLLGLLPPTRGRVRLLGEKPSPTRLPELASRLAYCPQNPGTYFLSGTVREELLRTLRLRGWKGGDAERLVEERLAMLGLEGLSGRNPRDLSSGQKEKLVLASALLPPAPELLVLDEPTRGVDHLSKQAILDLISEYGGEGGTAVVVTHDVEFAASLAGRAAILGGGQVIVEGPAEDVLGDSLFFSPQVNRLLADICPGVVREEEGIAVLRRLREKALPAEERREKRGRA